MVNAAERFVPEVPPTEQVFGNIVSLEWTRHLRQTADQGAGFSISVPSSLGQSVYLNPRGLLDQAPLSSRARVLLEEIEAFGLQRGWTFPVVDRINETFSVLMVDCTTDAKDQERLMEQRMDEIRTAFIFLSEGLAARSLIERHGTDLLTPREKEALSWVQIGRKSKEVAVSMGIETCTANDHIARATAKLEASNRTQAATRAMILAL
ncbi:MAG: LuxR C-terminal-related transcriptional regulator [Pseudomonadales bacterium]